MLRFLRAWSTLGELPRAVWLLIGATFINRVGTMALPFLVLYLTRHQGMSAGLAGGVLALYGATALVASPLAGTVADHLGPLRLMRWALGISGVVMVVYPFARGLPAIAGLTVLWALSVEAARPASLSWLAHAVSPAQRKQAFAFHRLAANLGMSVGPAVGGFLAQISFPSLFWIDGATTLGAALMLALTLRGSDPVRAPGAARGPLLPFGTLGDPRLVTVLLALLPVAVIFFQLDSTVPLVVVRELHLGTGFYGLMFTLNTLVIVAVEIPLNVAIGAWSHRRALGLGALFIAAGFGGMAFATGPISLLLTVLLWTIGEMLTFPGVSAYVAEIAPAEKRGAYMGLYAMTFSLGLVIGPPAGLGILQHLGARALWACVGALGLVAALVFSRLRSPPSTLTPLL